jgi:hypothetical protein
VTASWTIEAGEDGLCADRVGAGNSAALRGLPIFVEESAEPVVPDDLEVDASGVRQGLQRAGLAERPVGPVLVKMSFILGQDSAQVHGVEDEDPAEDLAACAACPALHDRVDPRRLRSSEQHAQAFAPEHLIEHAGELAVPVPDQGSEVSDALTQFTARVPGLPGDPGAGRIGGDPEDPDLAGGVLDDCEAVQAGEGDGVDGKEAAGQDPSGLGPEELPPPTSGRTGGVPGRCLPS